jgi:hypothetical protein
VTWMPPIHGPIAGSLLVAPFAVAAQQREGGADQRPLLWADAGAPHLEVAFSKGPRDVGDELGVHAVRVELV